MIIKAINFAIKSIEFIRSQLYLKSCNISKEVGSDVEGELYKYPITLYFSAIHLALSYRLRAMDIIF